MTASIFSDIASQERQADVLFSYFGPDTEYSFRFYDVMRNCKPSKLTRHGTKYFVLEGQPLHDYPDAGLRQGEPVRVHFSLASFQIAWDRCPMRPTPLKVGKGYDIIMTFKRTSKKKMVITELEVTSS